MPLRRVHTNYVQRGIPTIINARRGHKQKNAGLAYIPQDANVPSEGTRPELAKPTKGRGVPKYNLEYTRKNDPKVVFLVMYSGIGSCLQATGVVFRRKGSGGVHKQTHDKVLRSTVINRESFHNSLGLMGNSH